MNGVFATSVTFLEDMRIWIRDAFEVDRVSPARDDLLRIHKRLVQAEEFEGFIGRKYPTKKRFGAEGAPRLEPVEMCDAKHASH